MSYFYLFQEERGDCLPDSRVSEQSTLKRSHDHITNEENEKPEQSCHMETEISGGISSIYPGSELQSLLSMPASHSIFIPAAVGPAVNGFIHVPVTAQPGLLSPDSIFTSASQETRNVRDLPLGRV